MGMRIIPSLSERVSAAVIEIKMRDATLRWLSDEKFTELVVKAVEEHWARERPTPQKTS
jgi:hypothetical protein